MSKLKRDGAAKSVSRNQILRRERGQGKFPCLADHEQDWQLYPVDLYSVQVMATHAYIYTVACILNSRLVSGHLKVVAGALWGFIFPVCYVSVGVQRTILRALYKGTLTLECV